MLAIILFIFVFQPLNNNIGIRIKKNWYLACVAGVNGEG